MVSKAESTCPRCGGCLKYYDSVQRIVRTKNRKSEFIRIRRLRELPDFIFPYKQYESEIIRGVLEGLITCETLGFEDYPCEMTMLRWLIEFSTEVVCT